MIAVRRQSITNSAERNICRAMTHSNMSMNAIKILNALYKVAQYENLYQ